MPDQDSFEQWLAIKIADAQPLDKSQLLKAFEYTCKYGSGNSWAGTIGHGAAIIRELLIEIGRLKRGQASDQS